MISHIKFRNLFDRLFNLKMTSHKAKYVLGLLTKVYSDQWMKTGRSSKSGWN